MWFLPVLISLPFWAESPRSLPKPETGGTVLCSDISAVVHEAVAYHLTGAPTSGLPLTCALKAKWKYFNPNVEDRSEEPNQKLPKYTWFNPKTDQYKILKFKKKDDRYLIDVKFTIAGKDITTQYTYEPWDVYQKRTGVCGFVYNYNKPSIFRQDCQK